MLPLDLLCATRIPDINHEERLMRRFPGGMVGLCQTMMILRTYTGTYLLVLRAVNYRSMICSMTETQRKECCCVSLEAYQLIGSTQQAATILSAKSANSWKRVDCARRGLREDLPWSISHRSGTE